MMYTTVDMIFSKKESLDDVIIEQLLTDKKTAKQLLQYIQKEKGTYTIQALYVVLRELIASEVIIKNGFYYSINIEWKNKIQDMFSEKFIPMQNGEKSIYILNSLTHSDLQWKNSVWPLHAMYPHDPIFFSNYHYIWIHLGETREKSELEYYKSFMKEKRYAFCLTGSHSNLEIETKKMFESDYVRVYIDDKPIQSTGYITVINDYVITTQLGKSILKKIDECYKIAKNITELRELLKNVDINSKKSKLIIEHNRDKAKKLRKKMAKDFYIPGELREKFDLF